MISSSAANELTCTSVSGITMNPKGDIGTPDFIVQPTYPQNTPLYQQNGNFGTETPATNLPAPAGDPGFSPDGRWLTFAYSDRAYPHGVVGLRRADGLPSAEDALVFSDPDQDLSYPSFSPNGRFLVMAASDYQLDYVDLFGDRVMHRMPQPAAGNMIPAWLSDNRSVVMGGFGYNSDLVRQDVVTGASSTIPSTEGGYDPNVAPDGTILYSVGFGLRELSPSGAIDSLPTMAYALDPLQLPDRSHIYYVNVLQPRSGSTAGVLRAGSASRPSRGRRPGDCRRL